MAMPESFTQTLRRIDDADLDAYQRSMLMHIWRVGQSWESFRTLAEKCGMSVAKAHEVRGWLLENGFLEFIELGNGRIAVQLVCHEPVEECSPHEQAQQNRSPHEQSVRPANRAFATRTERSPHERHLKKDLLRGPNEEGPSEGGAGNGSTGDMEEGLLTDWEWEQLQSLTKSWLKLTGSSLPPDRERAGREYLLPLTRLLERVEWNVEAAEELLQVARREMLQTGKTPYRAAAVLPMVFAHLDEPPPNGQGYVPNEEGVY
jgi:hypothetical protein